MALIGKLRGYCQVPSCSKMCILESLAVEVSTTYAFCFCRSFFVLAIHSINYAFLMQSRRVWHQLSKVLMSIIIISRIALMTRYIISHSFKASKYCVNSKT